jgi:hypothetical protein
MFILWRCADERLHCFRLVRNLRHVRGAGRVRAVFGDWKLQEQAWWMMKRAVVNIVFEIIADMILLCEKLDKEFTNKVMVKFALIVLVQNGIIVEDDAPTEKDDAARYYGQADAV